MASISTRQRRRLNKAERRRRRKRQTRQARRVRRQLEQLVASVPAPASELLACLAGAFTRPTYLRFVVLLLAAVLTVGGRTVCNLLRTLRRLAPGDASSYHKVFSQRRWCAWRLARALAGFVLRRFVGSGSVELAGDDTVCEHPGPRVWGKGRHRDPVRSTHSYTAWRWGHKWVVLAVLVRFPFSQRLRALPVLVALYQPEEVNQVQGRRHKTPSELLRQMLLVLQRWFPERHFVCSADGNYATHEISRWAARRRKRLTYVSRFYADAVLHAPPPEPVLGKKGRGRPPQKGARLPTPEQVVQQSKQRQRLRVAWYGGGQRPVDVVSGTGHWYKAGQGLVEVRWVFVHDRGGTHRDEYFYSTDVTMSPAQIIETYTGRWNLETTFQELRSYCGLETTRGFCRQTVLRAEPCLFGLYTVVTLLYALLPAKAQQVQAVDWTGKTSVTFSDALTAVRRWLWVHWIFARPQLSEGFAKIKGPLREMILAGLAPAA